MVISPVSFPRWIVPSECFVGLPQSHVYYQRGTIALVGALMAILKRRGNERVHVMFPDYFCGESLVILEKFPIDISFYHVQKNLEPEWLKVKEIFGTIRPDAFVLVHYFGFPNNVAMAKKLCDEWGIELIEDCAHVLRPFGEIGTSGSFAVFSPWKLLPLPELGMLSSAPEFVPFIESYNPVYRASALIRWYVKREIQRFLCALGVNWYSKTADKITVLTEYSMNPNIFSMCLLRCYNGILEWARLRRIENYRAMEAFLKERSIGNLLFHELPEGAVPYCFPYLTKEPATILSHALIRRGIPAYPWPTLPLKIQKDSINYPVANWLAEHVLLLPIHQNVSPRQIEYMKSVLSTI